MIIDRLTQGGVMEPGQLYEPPFTGLHYQGWRVRLVTRMRMRSWGLWRRLTGGRRRRLARCLSIAAQAD